MRHISDSGTSFWKVPLSFAYITGVIHGDADVSEVDDAGLRSLAAGMDDKSLLRLLRLDFSRSLVSFRGIQHLGSGSDFEIFWDCGWVESVKMLEPISWQFTWFAVAQITMDI